jgi:chromosome segregation ATPase
MLGIFKTLFRVGLITAGCAGAAFMLAGQDRVHAAYNQAQDTLLSVIDANIDDPHVLRNQLRDLEREYPDRISQVAGDLAELNQQITQLGRDHAISERVVSLADADLAAIVPLIEDAEAAQIEKTAYYGSNIQNVLSIRFENHLYSLDQAYQRVNRMNQTRVAYGNRAADAAHDLVYLRQQGERLADLLDQLQTEQAQFQGQLWQLDQQVDAIARNDKLIDMLEKRKQTIDEMSRYECVSLDQMVARLDEVRARQQAELDLLTGDTQRVEYEDVARMQLNTERHIGATLPSGVDTLIYQGSDIQPKLR